MNKEITINIRIPDVGSKVGPEWKKMKGATKKQKKLAERKLTNLKDKASAAYHAYQQEIPNNKEDNK